MQRISVNEGLKELRGLVENNLPEGNKQMMAVIESCLSYRIKEDKSRRQNKQPVIKDGSKDLLHYLLQAEDSEGGPGFTPLELRGETELLLSAGFYITSAVLAAMFFHLTRNPSVYSKLTKEIRQAFAGMNEIVTGTRLSDCIYLRAVIDETMPRARQGSPKASGRSLINCRSDNCLKVCLLQ